MSVRQLSFLFCHCMNCFCPAVDRFRLLYPIFIHNGVAPNPRGHHMRLRRPQPPGGPRPEQWRFQNRTPPLSPASPDRPPGGTCWHARSHADITTTILSFLSFQTQKTMLPFLSAETALVWKGKNERHWGINVLWEKLQTHARRYPAARVWPLAEMDAFPQMSGVFIFLESLNWFRRR